MREKSGPVAYFSMEIGVNPEIKVYSGGLGILSGDHLKSAADLGLSITGVSLLYTKGFFEQRIVNGRQFADYHHFDPRPYMEELPERVHISNEGRDVSVKAWLMNLSGNKGHKIKLLFLDTNGNGNRPWDEDTTERLYKVEPGDNNYWRIAQENVLGVGGVRMLHELHQTRGWQLPEVYHLNEGHGAFAAVELLKKYGLEGAIDRTVFTTHTPVAAGHDEFFYGKIDDMMRGYFEGVDIKSLAGHDKLNMTKIALNLSRYRNGVAKRHGDMSRRMFEGYDIDSITNGVHSYTWTSDPMKKLFDQYIPEWRDDPERLAEASIIPKEHLLEAHHQSKNELFGYVKDKTGIDFDPEKLTFGFARRFAEYKRGGMMFSDLERLVDATDGEVQFIFSGKAHPNDDVGQGIIRQVLEYKDKLKDKINIAFLENYDMNIGKILTGGVDVWLNLPRRPLEASGTSGMKAAHNGVPSLSTNDGWWDEVQFFDGKRRGGWSVGPEVSESDYQGQDIHLKDGEDTLDLYAKIKEIRHLYKNKDEFAKEMQGAIKNAGFFNTHRMVKEYARRAYLLPENYMPADKSSRVFVPKNFVPFPIPLQEHVSSYA